MPGRTGLLVVFLLGLAIPVCLWAEAIPAPDQPAGVEQAAPVETYEPLPLPPSDLRVTDSPSDHGGSIDLTWRPSPDDGAGRAIITGYEVLRSEDPAGEFTLVGGVVRGSTSFTDNNVTDHTRYYYKVVALYAGGTSGGVSAGPAISSQQWFNTKRANLLVIALILVAAIVYYIYIGGRGRELHIRRIAGLEAVDEAVGRATEMGRPILFIPGIQDMDNVQTVAGMTILGEIAKMTARYETKLEVPVSRSIVMSTGRETVRQAYLEAGRPDLYNDDMVHYITDEQFGYVAAVDGIMVREKPAACFYLGAFFAESLILAETGSSIGAIQVAGTAMPTQIPFFVAACDYTLIGEELFAASAYLSKDRKMLGSIKGQDAGKAVAMVFIVVGVVLVTLAAITGNDVIGDAGAWLKRLFALRM